MTPLPPAADIVRFHDDYRPKPAAPKPADHGVWAAIEANHWNNAMLWEQEDLARRRHAPDAEIAANKRAIDRHNQQRNDAIERVDEFILQALQATPPKPQARLNSETAGSMIDRLSILCLKIRAMRKQTERTDVDPAHIDACRAKLDKLLEQRSDLASCLDRLLDECRRGESYYKVYRQFKMYNDPSLNPALYNERKRA